LTRRPRLLFLCHTVPYPLDGGVWIRTYHVLRLLAREFDITALCFERHGMDACSVKAAQQALAAFGQVEVFAIPQRHNRLRYAYDHLRSAAFRRVYTAYQFESRAFRHRLAEILSDRQIDLVHIDSMDLAGYFTACGRRPIACTHIDMQSEHLRRRGAIEPTPWRRAYMGYQARLTEETERRWCGKIALNVTVSQRDAELVKGLVPTARVAVVPNGVDIDEFRPAATDGTGTGVAYAGGINWKPNLDALDFFCREISPHLTSGPTVPARWIGSATAEQQRHYYETYGVELTGYVHDVRPFLHDAACHIVPLRAGGGTRVKILNSWAMGKAVVSTSIGCEGLEAIDGQNILIRDNPAEFAGAIRAVLENRDLRQRLGQRGRETAKRLYSWEVIGRNLIDTYLRLADGRRSAPAAFSAPVPAGCAIR
jgi:glycosyltransferase involved in cell wall biosynthesis